MNKTKHTSVENCLQSGDFEIIELTIPIAVFHAPVAMQMKKKDGTTFPKTVYAAAVVLDDDGVSLGQIPDNLSDYIDFAFPSSGVRINSWLGGLQWESMGSQRKKFKIVGDASTDIDP
jgi:hypothetical protein